MAFGNHEIVDSEEPISPFLRFIFSKLSLRDAFKDQKMKKKRERVREREREDQEFLGTDGGGTSGFC